MNGGRSYLIPPSLPTGIYSIPDCKVAPGGHKSMNVKHTFVTVMIRCEENSEACSLSWRPERTLVVCCCIVGRVQASTGADADLQNSLTALGRV